MSKNQNHDFSFKGNLISTFDEEGIEVDLIINNCTALNVSFSFEDILQNTFELKSEDDRSDVRKQIAQSLRDFLKTLED